MHYMALRKIDRPEATEDPALPDATFATVLMVGDESAAVTLPGRPAKERHSGTCT
jgi:hypothetical protein